MKEILDKIKQTQFFETLVDSIDWLEQHTPYTIDFEKYKTWIVNLEKVECCTLNRDQLVFWANIMKYNETI